MTELYTVRPIVDSNLKFSRKISVPSIQSSLQKSTNSDSENKSTPRTEPENEIKKKSQRLIDYAFGDGPYPISDVTGLPDVVKEDIINTIILKHTVRKERTGELDMKCSNSTQESRQNGRSIIKITPINSVNHVKLPTLQTEHEKNLKPVNIWRFWEEPEYKQLFYDPEKAEITAKEAPLKPDPNDITEKSKTEQQSYEVEKTEEISKENQLKPGLDTANNPDSARSERSYDTEKIDTVKKARLEQEFLHHFRETGTLEMDLYLDNIFKKDVTAKETLSKLSDMGLIHSKCNTNSPKSTPSYLVSPSPPYPKKFKSLPPDSKSIKAVTHSIEVFNTDKEPPMKYNIYPEITETKNDKSKSDAELLEYMERFRVDTPSVSNHQTTTKDHQSLQSLHNAEWKLKEAAEAFTQEIMKTSKGNGLAHAQNIVIKATSEFCNKINKDCASSKMVLMPNSADQPQEKRVSRLQTDNKYTLKVAKILPDVGQLDTKYEPTRNVISGTNRKSDILFETRKTIKITTSTTLGFKPYVRIRVPKTSDRNTNKERKEKQLLDEKETNFFISTEMCPDLQNKIQSQEKKNPDADASALKKPKTRKVDKLGAFNILQKLKDEKGIKEVQDPNEYNKTTEKNNHVIRPHYDSNWVQHFLENRYNTLAAHPPWPRAMSAQEKENPVKNETNSLGKFTPNCSQSVVSPLKTGTNKSIVPLQLTSQEMKRPILSTDLYGLSETENKTIPELEAVSHSIPQNKVTAKKSHRYYETKKTIKQTNSRSRFVKTSQLKNNKLLFDKPKETSESKASLYPDSIEKDADNEHNLSKKDAPHTKVNKTSLSVLLQIIRSRNQTKKVRKAVIAVFGPKFLKDISNSPTSSDSKRRKRLYFPSYENPIKTKITEQQDHKPGPDSAPVTKCACIKDMFNKPWEIFAGSSKLTNSDELLITKHVNEYDSNSLKLKILINEESIIVLGKHIQHGFPVPIKSIGNYPDRSVEILPKNGYLSNQD